MTNEYSIESTTLRQRIEAMPEDCILFRSDFPEYHTEFVGSVLSELTAEGMLIKIAHGIYSTKASIGTEQCFPRILGMAQYEQVRSQPSDIFR